MNNLAAVTCYYNPCSYERPRSNYRRFREGIEAAGVPLYTMELVFDDRRPEIPDAMHVHGTSRNVLWQKERLLNLIIDRLPADVDAIAWIDADILFTNPDWPQQTLESLDSLAIVQLFDEAMQLHPDGRIVPYYRGCGWQYVHQPKLFTNLGVSHPGFAWAARAAWLREHGLLDTNITGGGDTLMMKAMTDKRLRVEKHVSAEWMQQIESWAIPAREAIDGRVGYVPGVIHHLYHGSVKDRKYLERWTYLAKNRYDPATDLELDDNGLWRWSDHALTRKRRMVQQVGEYFALRKEDDVAARNGHEPEFTRDWFSMRIPQWERHLQHLMGREINVLEIGSYEGRSALWVLERLCTHRRSQLTCIDPWVGEINREREARFDRNTHPHRQRLKKIKGWSHAAMRRMKPETLDFIYVDGNHEGRNVLEDAVLAFRLLKPGGVLCFDDYAWDGSGEPPKDVLPGPAIDAFLAVYNPVIEVLDRGYQVWLRKLS